MDAYESHPSHKKPVLSNPTGVFHFFFYYQVQIQLLLSENCKLAPSPRVGSLVDLQAPDYPAQWYRP